MEGLGGYIVVAVSGLEDSVDAVGGAAAENDVGEGALLLVILEGGLLAQKLPPPGGQGAPGMRDWASADPAMTARDIKERTLTILILRKEYE
jgi:hypothetical protein